ncbi:hypothetical protein [Streptomyces violaceus]|uniref:Uncharacterized protein n=1 Tax=Streptomyces violaceus TaxID=1936 RepID=A0ABY9U401_STRVL|nr:hypothetical protein [Streptomyces janthinus]WND17210.1 hypothetical protein RI060_07555 [Streptomyces janthinus]GGS39771.1 hypothetical protein GCM10010270_06590 [Streptomyces janthinus]
MPPVPVIWDPHRLGALMLDHPGPDAVFFADVRGSMPDLVQPVGRALRTYPGEGGLATIGPRPTGIRPIDGGAIRLLASA